MAGYQLLADFNRSRRVERTQNERDARSTDPGAIVAANLDRDDRTLPARVAAGSEITLDAALASKSARDNDPASVLLAADRGVGQHDLSLAITSLFLSRRIQMLDVHKNVLRPVIASFGGRYDLGAQQNDVELFVEVKTLAGSPLRGIPTLTPNRVRRLPPPLDERRFSVTMNARPLAGGAIDSQSGVFTIAPWIMVDESAPLLRLYIVQTVLNHPTVEDVRRALPDPSKLTLVPNSVAHYDTWLQDQYELGCFHTPTGVSLVLLHMPRLRRDYTGRGATTGLPNFIRAHYPSRTVGVYDEFWQRTVPVEDITGQRVDIPFDVSAKVREALVRPFLLRTHLLTLANSVLTTNPIRPSTPPPAVVTLAQAMQDVAAWVPQVLSQLDREIASATERAARELFERYKQDVEARQTMVTRAVAMGAGGVTVTASDPPAPGDTNPRVVWTATITADLANRLEQRLAQMHASQNYGGNLQLGPPTPNAPYGRIFIGNDVRGREGKVDTELLNFLDKQLVQPVTQIDTSWLAVAHVDEILSFVPRRRGSGTHAIWLNSPKLALDIIRAARSHYLAGLPRTDTYVDHPSAVLKRDLNEGTSPVTAMFRGKLWHHVHQRASAETLEPPQLYIEMAEFYHSGPLSVHNTPLTPGPGNDRDYPAKMTIRELLYFESQYRWPDPNFVAPEPESGTGADAQPQQAPTLTTNELIESDKLTYLLGQIEEVYSGVGMVRVPTIYDIVRQPNGSTGAYTPNAANLIIADSRLLIPKPFGPRVRPVDAVAIITEAFTENGQQSLLRGFNERWLRNPRVGLLGVKQWFRHEDLVRFVGGDDLGRIVDEFKDGLVGISDAERRQLIANANRSHFRNGTLRSGWREITIPEDTVDLFEVAIALAATSLGMEWRFVDSWSYHITLGEIHCGTNALRTPSFAGVSPWWEFFFRAPAQPAS